jgi:fructose-1,6-bisphosphatase/inositol monophosphatase family enzyme
MAYPENNSNEASDWTEPNPRDGTGMAEPAEFAGELEFVKELASEAAAVAISRAKRVTPVEKANLSFVTDLDQDIEQLIRTRLEERYPDDRLTGEEYSAGGGSGPRRWSIDPIDGTGNLVHGLPLWAISIGLIESGVPVLGVVAVPPLAELYWAVQGQGAWMDGKPLHASDSQSIHSQDNICIGTNALRAIDTRSFPGRIRDLGSACCEQVFVAANRLQACTFLGEAAHDIAAGVVISSEAGCRFGTLGGERLDPAEMLRRTPITVPTFVAPAQRLQALERLVRPLPPREGC